MSRNRKTGKGLPRRVYIKHGSYRYFSPVPLLDERDGKLKRWHTLCTVYQGESMMHTALGQLLGGLRNEVGSMPYVCAEFKLHKLDDYEAETQKQYKQYLTVIADAFEEFHATQVTTKDCADFLRAKFKDKPNTAQKYTALLRKLFMFVIGELGLRNDNPVDQLDRKAYKTVRRETIPTHEHVRLIRQNGMMSKPRKDTGLQLENKSGPMFCCIVDMTYLLWARAVDIRTLKESQIEDGRIRLKPSKTAKSSGKIVDITITPQIQAVIDRARAIKKTYKVKGKDSEHALISPYLFPTQKGGAYTKSGLFSMWDRARERAGITEDVQFKDLRALGATDAARRGDDRKDIQKRLVHTSGKTTDIYIKEAIPDVSEIDMKLPWWDK